MTATAPVVLLIPGIFGFNASGPDGQRPLLEYFAGVKPILEGALPEGYVVRVHEPPPTGLLDERAAGGLLHLPPR